MTRRPQRVVACTRLVEAFSALGFATIDSLREVHGVTVGMGPPRAEVVVWTDDVDWAYADLAARKVRTLSAPHDFLGSLRCLGCRSGWEPGANRHATAA